MSSYPTNQNWVIVLPRKQVGAMTCNSCGSVNQGEFSSEVDIHFPGLRNVKKSPVLVYPELLLCLDCGKAEFTVPKDQLALLAKTDATAERS
jgi:hypothetical protein